MKVLVDSHIFLWILNNPELIGQKSLAILKENNTELLVSTVSIWELGLKYKKQKQPYSIGEMLKGLRELNAELLILNELHLIKFESIVLDNKDPFDMLLIAQSEVEHSVFMTVDQHILQSHARYLVVDASK